MRENFKKMHGREPLVWFDKYCIDQTAIYSSVRRLPIFVVAANKFFVLFGPSYVARCWCMLEVSRAKAHQPPPCEAASECMLSARLSSTCSTR